MTIYLNGSPKGSKGNSNTFINDVKNSDDIVYFLYKDKIENIVKDLKKSNTIVLSFPLYADSPTSGTLKFLEYINNNNINLSGKSLYTIINCGFLEASQNDVAEQIIESFCINNNIIFKGSFKIGAGVIIGKKHESIIYKLVSIPYYFKIKKFKKSILNNENIRLSTTIHPMPKWLYILIVNATWNFQRKKSNYHKKISYNK